MIGSPERKRHDDPFQRMYACLQRCRTMLPDWPARSNANDTTTPLKGCTCVSNVAEQCCRIDRLARPQATRPLSKEVLVYPNIQSNATGRRSQSSGNARDYIRYGGVGFNVLYTQWEIRVPGVSVGVQSISETCLNKAEWTLIFVNKAPEEPPHMLKLEAQQVCGGDATQWAKHNCDTDGVLREIGRGCWGTLSESSISTNYIHAPRKGTRTSCPRKRTGHSLRQNGTRTKPCKTCVLVTSM